MTKTATAPAISDERKWFAKNAWINTYGGHVAWPLDPSRTWYTIEDIAHSLAYQCRWNGHTKRFYSVAQHSCYAYDLLKDTASNYHALMHDAAEAYLTDVPRPIKPFLGDYKAVELQTEEEIFERFDIKTSEATHIAVKSIDNALLIFERKHLIRPAKREWGFEGVDNSFIESRMKSLPYWSPKRAELEFLYRWRKPHGLAKIKAKAHILFISALDKLTQFTY